MQIIAIIGGGTAGISVLAQLVEKLIEDQQKDISIKIIEKTGSFGPGLAYGTSEKLHVINLSADKMSPIADDPQHFMKWMQTNKGSWQSAYPEINIDDCSYPPRGLFGIYLASWAKSIQSKAAENKIIVEFIEQEVIDIESVKRDLFIISLKSGLSITSNQVILCIGHLPSSNLTELIVHKNYFHSPWAVQEMINTIPKDQEIHIIGSRLTAIDAVFALVGNGYTGKITLISRGGLLPAVIGPTEPYTRKFLNLETINQITGYGIKHVPLKKLIELFWKEIENAEDKVVDNNALLDQISISPITWLENEILAAKTKKRPWQSVLSSLYPIVSEMWNAVGNKDKQLFLDNYYSLWMTYLAAFPVQSAEKILELLKTGKLNVLGGLKTIVYNKATNKFMISLEKPNNQASTIEAAYLINATGAGHDIKKSDSVLLKNLLKRELIFPHIIGGINVDFKTLGALNKANKLIPNFYIIGDATWGACMATADLGQIGKEAYRLVNGLTENYKSEAQPADNTLNVVDGDKKELNALKNEMEKLTVFLGNFSATLALLAKIQLQDTTTPNFFLKQPENKIDENPISASSNFTTSAVTANSNLPDKNKTISLH